MSSNNKVKFISMGHWGDCYDYCFRVYNLPRDKTQLRIELKLHALKISEVKELCQLSHDSNGMYCVVELKNKKFILYRIKTINP